MMFQERAEGRSFLQPVVQFMGAADILTWPAVTLHNIDPTAVHLAASLKPQKVNGPVNL